MENSAVGLVMVIPMRINVNLKSLTINELKNRRKQLHLSMVGNLFQEAQRDLKEEITKASITYQHPSPGASMQEIHNSISRLSSSQSVDSISTQVGEMLVDFKDLVESIQSTDSTWFNDDNNYKNAMTSALDMKRGTLRKFHELRSHRMLQVFEITSLQTNCICVCIFELSIWFSPMLHVL